MKKKLLLTTLLFTSILMAQAPAIEWQKAFGGADHEYGQCIQKTADGGYILTANTSHYDGFYIIGLDISVYKLSGTGILEWQKILGGTDTDTAYSIRQTTDGGYILAGQTLSDDGDVTTNHGLSDAWIVKLTALGIVEWQKTIGGSYDESINTIQLTADGGYILAGSTSSSDGDVSANHGGIDYWVLKLSGSGILEWQKTFGGTQRDVALAIQPTDDGGYLVGGSTYSYDGDVLGYHGSADMWMLKLSASGVLEWQKILGGMNEDEVTGIQQTSDGGYILAGYTSSNGIDVSGNHGNLDVWIVKISSSGTLEWQKTFGGSSIDKAYSIEKTTDGGYIVAGNTYSQNGDVVGFQGVVDMWVLKLSESGNLLWQKSLGGSNRDDGSNVQQTADGGYIVSGFTFSDDGNVSGNHGAVDAWVVKLDSDLATTAFISQKLAVFPNPAQSILQLQVPDNISTDKITIIDLTGKTVLEQSNTNNQVNVAQLAHGTYIVQINSEGKTYKEKFIKN